MHHQYKAPERFFSPSIFTHPNPTRPPLSEVAACVFLSGGGVSGRITILAFQSMRIVLARSLPFSLCIVQVITTGWYSHGLGRRAGFRLCREAGGKKEVWGWMDERWRRREGGSGGEKHCYLASRSRGQHCCAAAAKSYRGSSGELFHSQPPSSLHTTPHFTISSVFFSLP